MMPPILPSLPSIHLFGALAVLCLPPLAAQQDDPHPLAAATLILANESDSGSVEIARTYQEARGIPEENVIIVPLSNADTISRREFVDTLWNPLRNILLERGLLTGEVLEGEDPFGRNLLRLSQGRARYLVACRGVPFRVAEDAELDDRVLNSNPEQDPFAYFPEPMRVNRASVDSELTLLFHNAVPMTAVLSNPLYGQMPPPPDIPLLRVTRLDGPTVESVLNMIRSTLEGERIGLRGRAYFDLALRSGAFAKGEEWIEAAAKQMEAADFDVTIERTANLFQTTDRFDTPVFYLGWYAGNVGGVFSLPDFRFPPGAIAVHLHSTSAAQLRHAQRGWVGPFVAAGVAATLGNVYEPYLEQTHNLELLTQALLSGMNFGDAAYAAVPSLSWQTVAVGDPLYRPFALSLDEQLRQLEQGDRLDPATDSHVIIRQMNRTLRVEEEIPAAVAQGIRGVYRHAGPALALKIAEWEAEAGDQARARRRLEFATLVARFDPQEWVLFFNIAQRLSEWQAYPQGAAVITHLLADERIPKALRLQILEAGSDIAREAGWFEDAVTWRRQWHELSAQN